MSDFGKVVGICDRPPPGATLPGRGEGKRVGPPARDVRYGSLPRSGGQRRHHGVEHRRAGGGDGDAAVAQARHEAVAHEVADAGLVQGAPLEGGVAGRSRCLRAGAGPSSGTRRPGRSRRAPRSRRCRGRRAPPVRARLRAPAPSRCRAAPPPSRGARARPGRCRRTHRSASRAGCGAIPRPVGRGWRFRRPGARPGRRPPASRRRGCGRLRRPAARACRRRRGRRRACRARW